MAARRKPGNATVSATVARVPFTAWASVLVFSLAGAHTVAARTYTLKEAVGDAVRQSNSVAAAEAKVAGARAKADEALYMFTPKLNLSGGWAHLDTAPYVDTTIDINALLPEEMTTNPFLEPTLSSMEPQSMRIYMGRQDNFQLQLQAEQILFAGTALYRQRAMALADLHATQEELRSARHDAVYQAEELFWRLALAREAVKVTAEALETAEAHVKLLDSYVKTGVATEADRMSARVQVASLKLTAMQVGQSAEMAENAFRALMHVPDGEPIELDLEEGLLPLDMDVDLDTLVDRARESRPEMRMLDHKRVSTEQAAGATWASWLPAVALQGNVYLKNPDRAIEPNWYWSGDITLGFQWNLWDRGAALNKHRQAMAGLAQIDAYRRQLRDGIQLEIQQAVSTYRQADEQLQVAKEGVSLAEENLRLREVAFEQGVSRSVDVLEAQTSLSKARLDELQAETNYHIAVAGLRRALGIDDERIAP